MALPVEAECRYDGLSRRIVKLIPNGENWDRTDYYYNESESGDGIRGNPGRIRESGDTILNSTIPLFVALPVGAEYRYDGLGRRIVKLIPNDENWDRTDYYYNESWQCLEERVAVNQEDEDDVATAVKVQWLWDIRYIDAPVCRWRDGNDDGDFLDSNELLFYCNDANMNVTALVNTSGTVVERYLYDPYGKVTICDGSWTEITWANSKHNEILYCGYRYDPETGLYHVRHRYYHPTLGRWMVRDPVGYIASYEYVASRSPHSADPQGLAAVSTQLPPGPSGSLSLTTQTILLGTAPPPTLKSLSLDEEGTRMRYYIEADMHRPNVGRVTRSCGIFYERVSTTYLPLSSGSPVDDIGHSWVRGPVFRRSRKRFRVLWTAVRLQATPV